MPKTKKKEIKAWAVMSNDKLISTGMGYQLSIHESEAMANWAKPGYIFVTGDKKYIPKVVPVTIIINPR